MRTDFVFVLVCYLLTWDSSAADSPPPGVPHHRRDERPIPKYKYSYMVRGLEGGQHGHQVYREGAYTQGKYFVRLNGGSGQNVEYYTDHFGYHPKVIYMNHAPTGSSGARIAFGRAATPFETSSATTETPQKPAENQTSTESHNGTDTSTPYPTETTLQQSEPNFNASEGEQYGSKLNAPATDDNEKLNADTVVATSPYPNEDNVRDNIYNSHSIGSIGPILLTHPSDEAYLQPEINEITNGFVGKIVSMLPAIIASKTKLLKPIIVTDSAATNKRDIGAAENSTDVKFDQVVDSAQPEEYREIPDEQIIDAIDNETLSEPDDEAKTEPPKYTEVEIKKPQVDVQIEPQTLEEQAVITTTVDITKSLPLALNFAPETDNHINDIGQPLALQSLNLVPGQSQVFIPPHNVLLPPHTQPDHPIMELQIPHIHQPFMLPSSEFHYIPIPVLQHQPNTIPLNYINDTRALFETQEGANIRHPVPEQAPPETYQRPEYSFVKSVEDYSSVPYKPLDLPRKPFHSQHLIDVRRQVPYNVQVPATHLLPYVKQNFIQPYPHPHHKQPLPSASAKSHSIAYNAKNYPKEKRTPLQKAPFKPSHPVWDSVYPPSHMYYVPIYVVDKVPGERNPKDSFSRRHHHLRRLYVEYGGFKPPLVPSTLIETEETAQQKRDVPKEGGGAES